MSSSASSYIPQQLNPTRIRSWASRLPLATRLVLVVLAACFIASLISPALHEKAILKPSLVNLTTLHKLSLFPFFHRGFLHLMLNMIALVPLLERFEAENGSLVTTILFTGPFATLPGAAYVLFEYYIFQYDTAVQGASIWVFLLLSIEASKMHRANPSFALGPYAIPTWTTPLILILVVTFLTPSSSLIGHLCGSAIGYGWGFGPLRFLSPPEKIVRWIEVKLNLLGRVPHYVSVDQKTYGRYGVLPSTFSGRDPERGEGPTGVPMAFLGQGRRVPAG